MSLVSSWNFLRDLCFHWSEISNDFQQKKKFWPSRRRPNPLEKTRCLIVFKEKTSIPITILSLLTAQSSTLTRWSSTRKYFKNIMQSWLRNEWIIRGSPYFYSFCQGGPFSFLTFCKIRKIFLIFIWNFTCLAKKKNLGFFFVSTICLSSN